MCSSSRPDLRASRTSTPRWTWRAGKAATPKVRYSSCWSRGSISLLKRSWFYWSIDYFLPKIISPCPLLTQLLLRDCSCAMGTRGRIVFRHHTTMSSLTSLCGIQGESVNGKREREALYYGYNSLFSIWIREMCHHLSDVHNTTHSTRVWPVMQITDLRAIIHY